MIHFTAMGYGISLIFSLMLYMAYGDSPWYQSVLFSSHLAACLFALFTGLLIETLFNLPERFGYYFGMCCGIVVLQIILKLSHAGPAIMITTLICNIVVAVIYYFRERSSTKPLE